MFLDVNIPMYAAGGEHPFKGACVWLMERVSEGKLDVAIDAEIVQEILHRFSNRPELAVAMSNSLLGLVSTIYPITEGDIRLSVQLFEHYAPLGVMSRDVIHAAVMINNGIQHIISVDRHFDLINEVIRLDPLKMHAQGLQNSAGLT